MSRVTILDPTAPPPRRGDDPGPDAGVLAAREMLGRDGMNCMSCHVYADHPATGSPGLDVTQFGERLRIKVGVPNEEPLLASITSIYAGSDFYERETWDMFGIVFEGHPDLTR